MHDLEEHDAQKKDKIDKIKIKYWKIMQSIMCSIQNLIWT